MSRPGPIEAPGAGLGGAQRAYSVLANLLGRRRHGASNGLTTVRLSAYRTSKSTHCVAGRERRSPVAIAGSTLTSSV